ncbi:MAG: ATP-dependent DNA helicase RecG [Candidatus Omnitrophica bacterium]|nr:ATP-dependent DNA helicase RecG [Candidatus Omnitrophota bacterium]
MYHTQKRLGKQRTAAAPAAGEAAIPGMDSPVRYLKGVGPARMRLLEEAFGVRTLEDLLYHFPARYEDRRLLKPVAALTGQGLECVAGTVRSRGVTRTRGGRTLLRAVIADGAGGTLFGLWFNQPYLASTLLPQSRVVLTGRAERVGRACQMVHPEYELIGDEATEQVHSGRIVPVYPLTEELHQKSLRQILYRLTRRIPDMDDPMPENLRARHGFPRLQEALCDIHFPADESRRLSAYRRLVYDEFLQMQALIACRRQRARSVRGVPEHRGGRPMLRPFFDALPFRPTGEQERCVDEILADMSSRSPMQRLVQGDVGSGKTVVAAAALAYTALNGNQGVLMAPTEVLAQQQAYTLSQLLEPLGIACGYLCGGQAPAERRRTLDDVVSGRVRVLVGTHALLSEDLRFERLGLVVIDEQHKFGVDQRARLKAKGGRRPPHLLLMTATPIPRTLAMTLYGEMDLSIIAAPPSGRSAVRTLCVHSGQRGHVEEWLRRVLEEGRQAYVVCPAISQENAASGLRDARAVAAELTERLPGRRVRLLHGRMSPVEKRSAMKDFKEHRADVLVSTAVVEVGIDVPNAALMIIENADRFGLAQLHQLRGRVGRGPYESCCIAIAMDLAGEGRERLRVFEANASGFDIAEKDLGLRGGGDPSLTAQHGLPNLRIGDLVADAELMRSARIDAEEIVAKDPELRDPWNAGLRGQLVRRYGLDGPGKERSV